MQYLLTEEEFRSLSSREEPSVTAIRIKELAEVMPTLESAVGCWQLQGRYGYCDDCILRDKRTVCTRYREFSK